MVWLRSLGSDRRTIPDWSEVLRLLWLQTRTQEELPVVLNRLTDSSWAVNCRATATTSRQLSSRTWIC